MRNTMKFPAILFVLFLAISTWQCGSEPAPSTPVTTTAPAPKTAPIEQPEPQFMQEGILEFYAPDGKRKLQRFDIEIAHDEDQRQQGLMFRKSMADTQGMLFVFDQEEEQSFWMHNTYIPLDIVYIDEDGVVVSIQKNCKILNDTPLPSGKPAQYVVEINGGLSDKIGLAPGSKTQWRDFVTNKNKGDIAF
jgi:uncharacterized membrane protein (UPF0127 family)